MADFLSLFQETADTIRARLDADANAGLDANDPDRIDVREGTFYYDITQSIVLELARIWDALGTEVPSAAFPTHAWGEYLDDHAETFGLVRKEATSATGNIRISGAEGVLVGLGSVFATDPATADAAPIEFETTESLTLSAEIDAPAVAPGVSAASGGSFATAGTYYYFVAASSEFGETLPSDPSDDVAVTVGQQVNVTWAEVAGASSYSVYRGTTTDPNDAVLVGTSLTESFTDPGNTTFTTAPNTVNQSAGGNVPVRAVEPGITGNVSAGAVANSADSDPNIYAVTNDEPTSGGAEVESDEELRARILAEYTSQGAGTVADYKRWALAYPGIGKAHVEPTWNGGGTVLVVVNDSENNAVQDEGTVENGNLVLGLQTQLDPVRLDSGTGTVSSLTVTDATKSWTEDQWVGRSVSFGTKYGVVTSNTATVLTVAEWLLTTTGASTSAPSSGAYNIGVVGTSTGLGLAPIGAAVTVKTATAVTVNLSASVVLKSGFTVETEQAAIESALDRYFAALQAGDDVVYRRMQSAFFESPGIADVGSLYVNVPAKSITNGTTDVSIALGSSPEIAKRGTVTLSVTS